MEKGTNPILINEIYRDSKLNGINVYKLSYYTCSDKIVSHGTASCTSIMKSDSVLDEEAFVKMAFSEAVMTDIAY